MSNRDGMAQSAGKPTLPPGRAAGATLVQPTVRLGVKSAGLLPRGFCLAAPAPSAGSLRVPVGCPAVTRRSPLVSYFLGRP